MQRRLAALAGQTDVGLGLKQRRCGSRLAALGREMKRRVAALVLAVHVRAAGQKFLDRLHVAHLCGGKNVVGSQ